MTVESSRITNMEGRLSISPEEEYRTVYRVTTTQNSNPEELLDDASDMFTATPEAVPRLWSVHPDDPGVICSSLECQPESKNNWTRWLVTATFTIPPDDTTGGGQPGGPPEPNPLLRPVRYSVEFQNVVQAIRKDVVTGNAFLNSAGKPFGAQEIERSILLLTCVKNYATLDEIIAIGRTYDQSVNDASYKGYGARQAKFESIVSSQQMYENGIAFYEGTIRIAFDPLNWDMKLVQEGWVYKAAGKTRRFLDDDNQPTTEPGLLDALGNKLAVGATPIFANFQIYTPKDYSLLGV